MTGNKSKSSITSMRAIVRGRVQGVSFRDYVTVRANELGVTGFVRNLPDGTVEVYAEGKEDELAQLTGYLETGPPGARVDHVRTTREGATGNFSDFTIRR